MTTDPVNVVVFADQVWDSDVPTNRQQVAARLPRHLDFRVLYVEPPSFALSPLFGLGRTNDSSYHFVTGERRRRSISIEAVSDSVHVISPLLPIPHRYAKRTPELVFASVRWFVVRAMERLDVRKPLVWSYSPFGMKYLPMSTSPSGIVYDCVDRYDQLDYYGDYGVDVSECQESMLDASDVVFVSSGSLYDRFSDQHPTVKLTGNAADLSLFETAQKDGGAKIASEIEDISSPIAGFYGVLSGYKLDFDLLESLVKSINELTLVLLGPAKADLPAWVEDRDDVRRVSRKSQHELPRYLTVFDVCLLPYLTNEYTAGVEPLKLYEYLAAAKPVVATPFSELPDLGTWLQTEAAGDEFVDAVRSILNSPPADSLPDLSGKDWSAKIDGMLSVLAREGLLPNARNDSEALEY